MLGKNELYIEATKLVSNDLKLLRRLQYLFDNNVFVLDEEVIRCLKARNYTQVITMLMRRTNKDITKLALLKLSKQAGILNYGRMNKEQLAQALIQSGVDIYV